MKKTLFTLLFTSITIGVFAQSADTTFWNKSVQAGINLNQASFNPAWKSTNGAFDNMAIAGFVFGKSLWVKQKHSLTNDLQLQFGMAFSEANLGPDTWRKNMDRIFFDNIYNYKLNDKWSLFASVLFQTQFAPGNRYTKTTILNQSLNPNDPNYSKTTDVPTVISSFLAPGYLDEGLGIEWKPVSYFSARFAPIAFRQTFVLNEEVEKNMLTIINGEGFAYGVKKGLKVRNQFGLNLVAKFDKDLYENINFKAIYQHFNAYDNFGAGMNRLDAILSARILKIINVSLQGILFYNPDVPTIVTDPIVGNINKGAEVQFSQALSVGIVYTIKSK